VPAVTAALDVAVLPSYREAQGLVILEAMALARPGGRIGLVLPSGMMADSGSAPLRRTLFSRCVVERVT